MKYSFFFDFKHQWQIGDYSSTLINKESFKTKSLGVFYKYENISRLNKGKGKYKVVKKPSYMLGINLFFAKAWFTIKKN